MVTNQHSWPLGATPNKSLDYLEPSIPSPQTSAPLDSAATPAAVGTLLLLPRSEAFCLTKALSVRAVASFLPWQSPVPDSSHSVHDHTRSMHAPRFAKRKSLLRKHFRGELGKPNTPLYTIIHAIFYPPTHLPGRHSAVLCLGSTLDLHRFATSLLRHLAQRSCHHHQTRIIRGYSTLFELAFRPCAVLPGTSLSSLQP